MAEFELFIPAYQAEDDDDEVEGKVQKPIVEGIHALQEVKEAVEAIQLANQELVGEQRDNQNIDIPQQNDQDVVVPEQDANDEVPEVPQENDQDMEIPEPNDDDQGEENLEPIPVEQAFNLASEEVVRHIVKYLSQKDMLICRKICKTWNSVLAAYPRFQSRLIGMFREKWYNEVKQREFNFETTLKWNTLKVSHFRYRRNSEPFKTYWHSAASNLDTLTIHHCSLECDGFIFLLDHCPVLTTLNLHSSKLRDLDDCQNTVKRQRVGAPSENPRPITVGLRNLNVDSMCRFEQCFMDYLNTRTGSLESITLSNCFHPPANDETPIPEEKLSAMAAEFLRNILVLFNVNSGTMRKYGLHNNNFQSDMFTRITPPQPISIPELALTLKTPLDGDFTSVAQFLRNCRGIEKLSLKFLGNINTDCISALARSCQASLQKLELIVNGNVILAHEDSISLDFLQHFSQLQEFRIHDSKRFHPLDVAEFIGGTRRIGQEVPGTITTPVSPSFLQNLPANVTSLSLDKYIALENLTASLAQNLDSYQRLTKLEIRGPWIHSMDGVVQIIAKEMLQLRTLALTKCALTDVQLTGLDKNLVATTRFRLSKPDLGPVTAETAMTWSIDRIKHKLEWDKKTDPRIKLSDLPYLEHLDLSGNPVLNNPGLVDALRMPGLKTLNLNGCVKMRNSSLEYLTLLMPGLEILHIKYCRYLTKQGLDILLRKCRKIKKIYTTRTTQNNNRDVLRNGLPLSPNYNDIVVVTGGEDDAHEY